MRIDTTASEAVRTRFIQEKAAELGVRLDPGALRALGAREVDLASIGTDLEKLALLGQKISLEDVVRETLASTDVKAYQYAAAAVAGRMHEAFGLVTEMFQSDRSAAVPLLAALASEYMLVWEAARPGGDVPAKARWRAGEIKANARALGERKARLGFERAVRGFEAVVTGRADDPRIIVDIATAAAAR
jgi:DNA polymerase III delta subunit